jgi:hypothetical protein
MTGIINAYKIFIGKRERKELLGGKRCMQENIKMDLRETGCERLESLAPGHVQWWALYNTVENIP